MCGINLIIDKRQSLDGAYIRCMAEKTRHRGPDETHYLIEHTTHFSCHMAANRLKITEQTDFAAQPFTVSGSRKFLLFNGEIYNHHTLKNKLLDRGQQFGSNSDTEVLFHWISTFGSQRIHELEGMFAFVFLDLDHEEILLCRDRFGIKPMYFHDGGGYFMASSEIKPIAESGLCPKRLNVSQLSHYLRYRYVAPPETFFEGIFELAPGSHMTLKNGSWEKVFFSKDKHVRGSALAKIETVEELITDSLLNQLESKVPTGLLLSGGVDSTLLLALAKKHGYTMPTFSIVNSARERAFGTEDYKYSRIAASLYKSDHHEIPMDSSLLDGFNEFISQCDQPIGDSSYLLTSVICKSASSSMKVLLSGAGADELFGGYNRHMAFYQYLVNKKLFDVLIPIVRPTSVLLPTGFSHPLRKKFRLWEKWLNSYDDSPYKSWLNFVAINEFPDVDTVQDSPDPDSWFEWALWHDRNHYLVSDVLTLTDKASMLHGVEVRLPYLHENLNEYMVGSDYRTLMQGGRKWMLKKILANHGGAQIANRTKEGFGLPLGMWLTDRRAEPIWEPLLSEKSPIFDYLDKQMINKLVSDQKRGYTDSGAAIWSLLVLAHWVERNFE